MSIEQYLNSKLVTLPNNLSKFLNICEVVLSTFWFYTLPRNMKPDVIETPVFEVIEVNIC